MENNFKDIIKGILSDKNKFFKENIDPLNKIETVLLELFKSENPDTLVVGIADSSIEHLLRVKIKVTLKQFELHLKDQRMGGSDFFKILFEQR